MQDTARSNALSIRTALVVVYAFENPHQFEKFGGIGQELVMKCRFGKTVERNEMGWVELGGCREVEKHLNLIFRFLNNWLISVVRQGHQDNVLVIAEDYNTLFKVNQKWPGHAVLIPPVLEASSAHKFGSLGFFNFTARRPQHLLNILELGYNVMYNDVDMVWLKDPFLYLEGNHDIYFMDDVAAVKPLNHSHDLPPPGKKGRPYVCSCMIFLRPTDGAKLAMRKWIEELQEQPWTRAKKANDQPAFNWALMKNADQVDMYLLPQSAFPTGGLYFKNKTWVRETKGSHVIIHNNYILGFEKKIKRFRDYGLWLADDYSSESPLGRL
ncbi:hypothetical protein KSS87_006738 [Heliosperma pusillum]|nr:hypothetical protein KSS87_006738 [Heliosperma pusillum]